MPSSKQDMSSAQEIQHVDRELSSELAESPVIGRELFSELTESPAIDRELSSELAESPINPAFLRMSPPFKDSPMFHLQVNGEALWRWRKLNSLNQLFDVLQKNLSGIGYSLSGSSRARVRAVIKRRVDYFSQKVRNTSDNSARRAHRSEYWCDVALQPDEIVQEPSDIISELQKDKQKLAGEIEKSQSELEGVEKKNDDLRRYFHRKINRWDAATNLLLVEKRQDMLRDKGRTKRPYDKRDDSFWLEGGKQEAAKKVQRISTAPQPPAAPPAEPIMEESELRKKKVAELITLLEQRTGKRIYKKNKKTRRDRCSDALLEVRVRRR